MAHFVELNPQNIVIRGVVVGNKDCLDEYGVESETVGIMFCRTLFGADTVWKQTSYNTYGNVHSLGGRPFRKNYAGIGYFYDQNMDAFIPPKPYPSWNLNTETCLWEAPVLKPANTDSKVFMWNEEQQIWEAFPVIGADQ